MQVDIGYSHIEANGSSCYIFTRIRAGFVATWKASCGKPRDCFTRCKTPKLVAKINVSKFYAWQVGSWMNEQQSQNLLLKVDPLSIIRKNKLNMQGEKQPSQEFLYWIYPRCLQLNRWYTR